MLIALYPHHHSLPFWHKPQNPCSVYDRSIITDEWTYKGRGLNDNLTTLKTKDHWMIPILDGLNNLNLLGLMAHVSCFIDAESKTVTCYGRRIWIQISTLATETIGELPVIVKDGKVQVQCLWGEDNKTHVPLDFVHDATKEETMCLEFWTEFFHKQLREAKEDARKAYAEAIRQTDKKFAELSLYDFVH